MKLDFVRGGSTFTIKVVINTIVTTNKTNKQVEANSSSCFSFLVEEKKGFSEDFQEFLQHFLVHVNVLFYRTNAAIIKEAS